MQEFEESRRSAADRVQHMTWSVWVTLACVAKVVASLAPERQARAQRAQTFIEYAILAGLLGVAIIVALTAFGPQLAGVFTRFGARLAGLG